VDPVLIVAIVVSAAVAFPAAIWWAQPRTRARRLLRKVRNVPIAEIKDGAWVKVTGAAHAIGPIATALVSRRDCIGFQVQVQQLEGMSAGIVLRRESCPTFAITDETGTVEVDGPFLFAIDWGAWSIMTATHLRILKEGGIHGRRFWRRFSFRESLIQPGDVITVFGLATFEPDPTASSTDLRSPALKIHLRGSGNQRVILADAGSRVSR